MFCCRDTLNYCLTTSSKIEHTVQLAKLSRPFACAFRKAEKRITPFVVTAACKTLTLAVYNMLFSKLPNSALWKE